VLGSRSLLRQTLDRIRPVISSEQTVVVTHRDHERYLGAVLDGAPVGRALVQPEDRGTAAGVVLPTYWISWCDPEAIVAVFPSDHFISDDRAFMEQVADVIEAVRQHPDRLVVLGAVPTDPDAGYGWIEPGEVVAWTPAGEAISCVNQFWEKPSPTAARAFLVNGWLWNTFVFVARVSLLLDVTRQFLPDLHERFAKIRPFKDTELERWAFQQAYAPVQKASFSRSVLELRPASLVVSRLHQVTWSDWGTPERVTTSLRYAGLRPAWMEEPDLSSSSDA
jgi:mannose-1-phosphate guanylyltransferase